MTTAPGNKHRVKVSKGNRHAVYVRDNWTCQDCGRQFAPSEIGKAPHVVDPTSKPPLFSNDTWLEVDHIRPLLHGGSNTIDNMRALCTPCNKRKGATILETTDA